MNYLQTRLDTKREELLKALELEESYWTRKIESAGEITLAQERFFKRQIERIELTREYLSLERQVYGAVLEDYERLRTYLSEQAQGLESGSQAPPLPQPHRISKQKESVRYDSIQYSDWMDNV